MTINMNNQITGGIVSVEDGIKAKEEYAPARKIKIELHFDTPEGGDGIAILDYVTAVANGRCLALVHGKAAPVAATEVLEVIDTPTNKAKPAAKPKAKTKAEFAKEQGLPTTDTVHKGKPASQVEETLEEEVVNDDDDGLNDLLGDTAPAPITDAELSKAAQTKVALMKTKYPDQQTGLKVRELIVAYVGPQPKKLADMAAAKRQEFLDKLKDLG